MNEHELRNLFGSNCNPKTFKKIISNNKEEKVEVTHYDPEWPEKCANEILEIQRIFGKRAVNVDHFGSTAVPGMSAKPIIDIMVGLDDSCTPCYASYENSDKSVNSIGFEERIKLANLGYECHKNTYLNFAPSKEFFKFQDQNDKHNNSYSYWRKRPKPGLHNLYQPQFFNLQIMRHNSQWWKRHIDIRDYLRANSEERNSYIIHKKSILENGVKGLATYNLKKDDYMNALHQRAIHWRETQRLTTDFNNNNKHKKDPLERVACNFF